MRRFVSLIVFVIASCPASAALTAAQQQALATRLNAMGSKDGGYSALVSYPICGELLSADQDIALNVPVRIEYSLNMDSLDVDVQEQKSRLRFAPVAIQAVTKPTAYSSAFSVESFADSSEIGALIAVFKAAVDEQGQALLNAALLPKVRAELERIIASELIAVLGVDDYAEADYSFDMGFADTVAAARINSPLCPSKAITIDYADTLTQGNIYGRGFYVYPESAEAVIDKDYIRDQNNNIIAYSFKQDIPNDNVAFLDVVASARSSADDSVFNETHYENKVVGGHEVNDDQRIPWMVAFASKDNAGHLNQFCAGTLYRNGWVITAAHCNITRNTVAILGRNSINGSGGQERKVDSVWKHADFRKNAAFDSDIALVKLAGIVPETGVDPATTATTTGETITVYGWGAKYWGGETVEKLRVVDMDIIPHASCQHRYRRTRTKVVDTMFCAHRPNVDSCKGDSGGGAYRMDPIDGKVFLKGIVSYGKGCAEAKYPGVYSDVYQFTGWLNRVIEARTGA